MATKITYPASVNVLRREAKKYYRQIYTAVAQGKDYQEIDIHTITVLCIEYSKYLDATDYLNQPPELGGGLIIENTRHDKVPSPAVAIQKSAMNSMKVCWMSLGLTPEARKKITQGAEPGQAKNKKKAKISTVK